MGLSFTSLITLLFSLYLCHSMYHFYLLFTPETCADKTKNCKLPFFEPSDDGKFPLLQLRVYTSASHDRLGSLVLKNDEFQLADSSQFKVNITLPGSTRNNGSLYVFSFLLPQSYNGENPQSAQWSVLQQSKITTYRVREAETFKLISDDSTETNVTTKKNLLAEKPVSFLRTVVPLTGCSDAPYLAADKIPGEIRYLMNAHGKGSKAKYLPIFYLDSLSFRNKDLAEIKRDMKTTEVTIDYRPSSMGKLRLLVAILESMEQLKRMGFLEKDIDDMKSVFVDTNPYLLALTFVVATVHLLFDCLSFKNDISFWKQRKTMVGLSTKAVLWSSFYHTVIFLYLLDQDTSLLVLAPSGVSVLIEYWKVKKALKISFSFSGGLQFGSQSVAEKETEQFDAQAMRYLSYVMIPLCFGGAVYNLIYTPHKSWYSWVVQSMANGVYAFGFLFMLPQLFVNYKLKSVAHLPWRAFMYKAFNTFIDDIFAFIITMPTSHRVACFRDDLVFLVYLYQRYLYPVDKSRVNEFGETGEEATEKDKTE
ncbi:unnamed protein product [Auanema sp. JU1783]|nr:unnamed protein product [Auanema sp. JU1783]